MLPNQEIHFRLHGNGWVPIVVLISVMFCNQNGCHIHEMLINFSMGACYLDFTVCLYTYVTSVGVCCR